jgi:hypothetical protein
MSRMSRMSLPRSGFRRGAGPLRGAMLLLAATLVLPSAAGADSSVRAIRRFDSYLTDDPIPGKNPGPLLTPSKCRTTTYTAGANEVAVVQVSGTVSPSVLVEGNLNIVVSRSLPFQPFVSVNAFPQSESLADGTASANAVAKVPLVDGYTYQFGAGFSGDQAIDVSVFSCQGVVIVYRIDP